MFRCYGELTVAHQYKDHMLLPSSYNYLVVNTTWLQTFAQLLYLTYFQIHAISASFRTGGVPNKRRFATDNRIKLYQSITKTNLRSKIRRVICRKWPVIVLCLLFFAAGFWDVTQQQGGALRDIIKNSCEGDYPVS